MAGHCKFGASLDETLRDQLIIGIANDMWQKEVFRLYATNASTLAQVEPTVLALEQASQQQQRLHGLTKQASAAATLRHVESRRTLAAILSPFPVRTENNNVSNRKNCTAVNNA
jgi:hypothetical protein